MPNTLKFESGQPTILEPSYIEEFGKHHGHIEGVKAVRINEDHRLFWKENLVGFESTVLLPTQDLK